MAWLQLALVAYREQAALIEAALENGGALAVTIDDAADDPMPDPILEPAPNATPLWRQVRITALYGDDPQGTMLAEQAADSLGFQSLAPPLITTLDDRPWERVWLEELEPMRFGRRLWICPHGQRPDAADGHSVIINLDPGLAFGTGHHPPPRSACVGSTGSILPTARCSISAAAPAFSPLPRSSSARAMHSPSTTISRPLMPPSTMPSTMVSWSD